MEKLVPALILGLGGTGVKVCRFIQTLADHNPESDLAKHLDQGSIQLVAIDTDKKSNDPHRLEACIFEDQDTNQKGNHPEFLSKMKGTFIHADADLPNTLKQLYRYGNIDDLDSHPVRSVANWFPKPNVKNRDQISFGQSKVAGAAQWRPLGRAAFFLKAPRIHEDLQIAYSKVQKADPSQNGKVRCYVVSSLAGGTGSGMFLDAAFLLQMIELGKASTVGMFLLGEPFQNSNVASRVFPNVYAALKEMRHYKNWNKKIKVEYPFRETFEGNPNGPVPFEMCYLYQGFSHRGKPEDPLQVGIDLSCHHIAQSIIAQLRYDLFQKLDVSKNNVLGDTAQRLASPEAGYCFSTSAATSFHFQSGQRVSQYFAQKMLQDRQPKETDIPEPLAYEDLLSELGTGASLDAGPILEELSKDLSEQISHEIPDEITNLEKVILDARQNIKNDTEKHVSKIIHTVFPKDILEQLKTNLSGDLKIGDMSDAFEIQTTHHKNKLVNSFKDKLTSLKQKNQCLNDDARDLVKSFLTTLKHKQSHGLTSNTHLNITIPNVFKEFHDDLFRIHWPFDIFSGSPEALAHLKKSYLEFLSELEKELENLKNDYKKRMPELAKSVWAEALPEIEQLFESFLGDKEKLKISQETQRERTREAATYFKVDEAQLDLDPSDLQNFLGSIIPPDFESLDLDAWSQEIATTFYQFKVQIPLPPNGESVIKGDEQLDKKRITEAVGECIQNLYKDKIERHHFSEKHMLDFLRIFFHKPSLDSVSKAKSDAKMIKGITHNLVAFWNEQANTLTQKAGGQDGLKARLDRCKSRVFGKQMIDNHIRSENLVIVPPISESKKENRKDVVKAFKEMSQSIMGIPAMVANNDSEKPLIYYEDLFRPAQEITKIEDYYQAYARIHPESRAMYHINREASHFEEIIALKMNTQPRHCGNNHCTHDINGVSRDARYCPGCSNPIWNRCGNKRCLADDVWLQIKGSGKHDRPDQLEDSTQCPACHGELKNYWWRCKDRQHRRKLIPAARQSCPECVKEFKEQKRIYKRINYRPDIQHTDCPGCMSQGITEKKRCQIPGGLEFYFKNGNGDSPIPLSELIDEYLAKHAQFRIGGDNHCLVGDPNHLIFPACQDESHETPYFLTKNSHGYFYCDKHPSKHFYVCHNCDYPISEDELGKECPRCHKMTQKCHYCTDIFNRVYQPVEGLTYDRCPHCQNHMSFNPKQPKTADTWHSDLKRPGFCGNIYNCDAATNLWHTATNCELDHCLVCNPSRPKLPYFVEREDSKSRLHDIDDLSEIVERCPMCLVNLGLRSSSGRIAKFEGRAIVHHFASIIEDDPYLLEHSCDICGFFPNSILAWMEKGEFLVKGPLGGDPLFESFSARNFEEDRACISDHIKKEHRITPEIDFDKAKSILQTFINTREDHEAYQEWKRFYGYYDMKHLDRSKHENIVRIMEPKSLSQTQLLARFKGIWAVYDRKA